MSATCARVTYKGFFAAYVWSVYTCMHACMYTYNMACGAYYTVSSMTDRRPSHSTRYTYIRVCTPYMAVWTSQLAAPPNSHFRITVSSAAFCIVLLLLFGFLKILSLSAVIGEGQEGSGPRKPYARVGGNGHYARARANTCSRPPCTCTTEPRV